MPTSFEPTGYEWSIDDNVAWTASDFWYSIPSNGFTLRLSAWDDSGHGNEDSIWIDVSSSNAQCVVE